MAESFTPEEKIEFCNMLHDLQKWSGKLYNNMQRIEIPPAEDVTEAWMVATLRALASPQPDEELADRLENWLQRFFS
jgi:hypothetical protein